MRSSNFRHADDSANSVSHAGTGKKSQAKPQTADSDLSWIAGRTARDHSVKVFIGEKDGGSFADLDTKEITLDPEHIKDQGAFVAAHEGAHIGETVSLQDVGKNEAEQREYAGKIGFHALRNVIEDCAINDRFSTEFPTLQKHTLNAYPRVDSSSMAEDGILNLPEVVQIAQRLGRSPVYAQVLSGILSDWSELRHQFGFKKSLSDFEEVPRQGATITDPDVLKFFKDHLGDARHAASLIPVPGASGRESFEKGVERLTWCEDILYPALKLLVDKDLKDLAKQMQKSGGSPKGCENGQDGSKGGSKKQGSSQSSGNNSPGKAGRGDSKDSSQGQSSKGQDGSKGGSQKEGSSRSSGNNSSGRDGRGDSKDSSDAQSSNGLGSAQKMSESEANRKAKEMIAAVDDAIRRHLQSLKDEAQGTGPSASEVVREQNNTERREEAAREAQQQADKIARQLRESLNKALTPYHLEYQEIATALEEAHNRLVDVFEPERHFKWQTKQPSGSRVDMNEAMRFELTGKGYDSLWQRRIDPKYPDTDVVILLDRSGSMETDKKWLYARRALILAKELFDRLHIRCAIVGFADSPRQILDFDDDISEPETQNKLMKSSEPLDQGTRDATAIKFAAKLLAESTARQRAIVMLSDAGTGEAENELKNTVSRLNEEGLPVLHFGLGVGTKDTSGSYIHSWGDLSLSDSSPKGFLSVFCRELERLAQDALM